MQYAYTHMNIIHKPYNIIHKPYNIEINILILYNRNITNIRMNTKNCRLIRHGNYSKNETRSSPFMNMLEEMSKAK